MSANSKLNFGLEREFFVGDQIFEQESARIFSKNWICVARREDFDRSDVDSFRTVQVGLHNLIVVRRKDGSFRAFHNLCRHRGTRLLDVDCGVVKKFVCHLPISCLDIRSRWEFDRCSQHE